MNDVTSLLMSATSRTLALALVHFLWQGALVAAALFAVNALLRRASARARYGAACAALALMLALPAATAWRLSRHPADPAAASIASRAETASGAVDSELLAYSIRAGRLERLAPWIVLAWFGGVWLLSVRLAAGFLQAESLRRRHVRPARSEWEERLAALAARLRLLRPVGLLESALVEVPTAVGILRPVVLLPLGLATGLTAAQLDSLLAHELAHVRRRDCLVNLLQAFAETLLFYHPAVWWVSQRIRIERENACDDLAVQATGDREVYARALVDLEERRRIAPRFAVAADGGLLWNRITRLFPSAETEAARSPRWLAAVLALGGMFALGVAAAVPPVSADPTPMPKTAAAASPGAQAATGATPATTPAPAHPTKKAPSKGNGLLTPDQLVAFRIHGVTPEFIDQIVALGYERPSADDLVALRIHGATPEYIARMMKIFGRLPLDEYASFRIHDLTPESLRELEGTLGKLSADDALAMRIHGVTPQFATEMRSLGFTDLSADELVAFRIHGVTPAFAREIRDLGYGAVDADDLVSFRIHGVTPEYIRSLNQKAGRTLSADRLIDSRIHGEEEGEK